MTQTLDMPTDDAAAAIIAARSCGDCHMCCRIFPIAETGKADHDDCPHLRHGTGCTIYAARPGVCRDFLCLWRTQPGLDDTWKPSVCGFVLHDPEPWSLLVSVDPASPEAWRAEPYASQLHQWAADLQSGQHLAGVRCGERMWLLLKDGEVELNV